MPTPFGTSQVTSCGFWHRLHRIPWLSVHLGLNKLCSFAFQLEAKPLGDRSLARAVINGRGALSSGFTCRRRRRSPLSHPSVLSSFFTVLERAEEEEEEEGALELSGREQRGSNVRCAV